MIWMSSNRAPNSSAITWANVVSSPCPCEAMPKLPVTAPVESSRVVGQGGSRHVDQPLHDKGRDWPAHAAIGPDRRLAGGNRARPPAIVRHPVRTGHEADDLHRFQRGGPRIDRIGPNIADRVRRE